jgi:hypothetical protein
MGVMEVFGSLDGPGRRAAEPMLVSSTAIVVGEPFDHRADDFVLGKVHATV